MTEKMSVREAQVFPTPRDLAAHWEFRRLVCPCCLDVVETGKVFREGLRLDALGEPFKRVAGVGCECLVDVVRTILKHVDQAADVLQVPLGVTIRLRDDIPDKPLHVFVKLRVVRRVLQEWPNSVSNELDGFLEQPSARVDVANRCCRAMDQRVLQRLYAPNDCNHVFLGTAIYRWRRLRGFCFSWRLVGARVHWRDLDALLEEVRGSC